MNTCGVTRLLVLAWLVGLGTSTLSGSSTAGWVAAAVALAVAFGFQRLRGGGGACPVPTSTSGAHAVRPTVDEVPQSPSR